MSRRRAWVIGGVAGVVVVAGVGAVVLPRVLPGCGDEVTSLPAAESSSPFLDAGQRRERPDRDRDALVRALAAAPTPFGDVLGAVGYHYEQWAQVGAYAQGIGVRTRDNPDFTMLDDRTLEPRWSVEVGTRRSAYDASDDRYLVVSMPADKAPELVALDAGNGRRVWCTTLGGRPVAGVEPFATQVLADEDVAVLRESGADRVRLARLDHEDGSQEWARTLVVDRGDFLGELGEDGLLMGGREPADLFDPRTMSQRPAGVSLVLVSAEDGKTIWTRKSPAGSGLHVVGTSGEVAVLQHWDDRTRKTRLSALDSSGRQLWSTVPDKGTYFDAAVRSGRVLVRAGSRWSAYDLDDGSLLWARTLPDRPQALPYGFELASVPLLDDDHVLVGGTTAMHTLDLGTGAMTSAKLPVDGINTTYWPYQVAVSAGLVAVATNTGAVVTRRE